MSLAFLGGKALRTKAFPHHNNIGKEEKEAVARVLDSGCLSGYIGSWHKNFMGGPEVRALEEEWADYFKVKYAIAVNSCTSGLICAIGATGCESGDEVILPPYTMSATAMAPLVYNALPIFSDIEEDYFCLDPEKIEEKINEKTKAIVMVDLFGQSCDADKIRSIAKKHRLYLIEDTAQAPGAMYKGKAAGTLGDIGVFSLNYHKHIHSGEGGVIVTDNEELAKKMRLIRNHAESVVEGMKVKNLSNMLGFNFRMTEIEAAIARCQLKKLKGLLEKRLENCDYLARGLSQIPAITPPVIREESSHAFYVQACLYDESKADGISRDLFIEAVRAELPHTEGRENEGVKLNCGYVRPLYLLPVFQEKILYGGTNFPFISPCNPKTPDYSKGSCPVCEELYTKSLFTNELMLPSMEKEDLDSVIQAFMKVWENKDKLKKQVSKNGSI